MYRLHGRGSVKKNWIQRGDVKSTNDKVTELGGALSMIIVMPVASEVKKAIAIR